jgi:hypothetical protein
MLLGWNWLGVERDGRAGSCPEAEKVEKKKREQSEVDKSNIVVKTR